MFNINELIEEMIKQPTLTDSTVMYSRGKYKTVNINQLQIVVSNFKFNLKSYNIFIIMENHVDIDIIVTVESATKIYSITPNAMMYKELFNRLIDFAENVLQLPIEEFTEETIKYFNDTSPLVSRSRISRFE